MLHRWLIFWAAGLLSSLACAGVTLENTRVIYPGNARQVDLVASNPTSEASLIQVWIDDGDISLTPDNAQAPFTITPPLARVMPGTSQTLRIIFTGADLPSDKESLFFLNMLDTPPKPKLGADTNFIQFAMRSRIKLLFRPPNLPDAPFNVAGNVRWKLEPSDAGLQLVASNASPYVFSLVNVRAMRGEQALAEFNPSHVPPFGSMAFRAFKSEGVLANSTSVKFQFVDDYGAYRDLEIPLTRP
jgi:chaperone protein EcpD